jgi:hypothetical protein
MAQLAPKEDNEKVAISNGDNRIQSPTRKLTTWRNAFALSEGDSQ